MDEDGRDLSLFHPTTKTLAWLQVKRQLVCKLYIALSTIWCASLGCFLRYWGFNASRYIVHQLSLKQKKNNRIHKLYLCMRTTFVKSFFPIGQMTVIHLKYSAHEVKVVSFATFHIFIFTPYARILRGRSGITRSRPKLNCGPGRDFEVGPEFGAARKQPIIPGNSRARSCAGEEDRVTWLDLRPG